MRLEKAIGPNHRPAYVHNPKHFYSNSFQVEKDLKGRKVVTGKSRNKHKNFKIVCILKPDKTAYQNAKNAKRRLF